MYSGLGLAPVVVGALVQFGTRILGGLLGPSEIDLLEQEAQSGNIVAWWVLKARAGTRFPIQYPALTDEEREAVRASVGSAGLEPGRDIAKRYAARARIIRLYESGTGARLDAQAQSSLLAQAKAAGAPTAGLALAGFPWWVVLVGGGLLLATRKRAA